MLDFNESEKPEGSKAKTSRKAKTVLGVGTVAGLAGIGSTLAANISLNNGGAVEFGQGVAQTAACDQDGFQITPFNRYNNSIGMFVLDHIEITGLNLTPVGTNESDSEKTAHPGTYKDGDSFVNTCDQVVLDLKAFTNNPEYSRYTVNGYEYMNDVGWNETPTNIQTPLFWNYNLATNTSNANPRNSNLAFIVDAANSTWNYGSDARTLDESHYYPGSNNRYYNVDAIEGMFQFHLNDADSAVKISVKYFGNNDYSIPAGAISRFVVQSSSTFPSGTYDEYSGEIDGAINADPNYAAAFLGNPNYDYSVFGYGGYGIYTY